MSIISNFELLYTINVAVPTLLMTDTMLPASESLAVGKENDHAEWLKSLVKVRDVGGAEVKVGGELVGVPGFVLKINSFRIFKSLPWCLVTRTNRPATKPQLNSVIAVAVVVTC